MTTRPPDATEAKPAAWDRDFRVELEQLPGLRARGKEELETTREVWRATCWLSECVCTPAGGAFKVNV